MSDAVSAPSASDDSSAAVASGGSVHASGGEASVSQPSVASNPSPAAPSETTASDPRLCPLGGRHEYAEVAEREDGWADNSILFRCGKCGAEFWHHNTFC